MAVVSLIKFTLHEYYLATGFICEVLTACLFIFLFSDHYWLMKAFDIYFGLGMFAVTAAFLTTYRIAGREANPRIYIMLTKGVSRREYLLAKLSAAFIVFAAMITALFALGYYLCDVKSEFAFFEALARLSPIYITAMATAAATLFFSKIVRDNIVAALIVIIFSFAQPPGILNYMLPPLQQLVKMSFGDITPYKAVYIFWGLFFIAAFFTAAVRVFEKRELDFDKN